VDKLTKVAHFIAGNLKDDSPILARRFVHEIFRLHGVPELIISDRDPIMTLRFWKTLNAALRTKLNFSFAYHPETDGKTKRVNQDLEDMLRMYYMDQQYKWEEYLPLVEFAYNNTYHASLKMTPFEELYERKCRTPVSWDSIEDREVIGPEILTEMEQQVKLIRECLEEVADRQQSYTDLKRVDRKFKLGEKVFLRVKLKKSSITFDKAAKLSP
ncbi:hypothetical protein KI387_027003, partial [Taxus chinensis]